MYKLVFGIVLAAHIALAGYSPISIDTNAVDIQPAVAPGQLVSAAEATRLSLSGIAITNWQDLIYILGTNEFPEPPIPEPPSTDAIDNPYLDALTMYYSFDESYTNGIVEDMSEWGTDASVGAYTWTRPVWSNYASWVVRPYDSEQAIARSASIYPAACDYITLSYWFRPITNLLKNLSGNGAGVLPTGGIYSDDLGLSPVYYTSPNRYDFYLNVSGLLGYVAITNSVYDLSDNRWHHVLFVVGGVTDFARVYVDSRLVGSPTIYLLEGGVSGANATLGTRDYLLTAGHLPAAYDDFISAYTHYTGTQVTNLYQYYRSLAPTSYQLTAPADIAVGSTTASVKIDTESLNKGKLWVHYDVGADKGTNSPSAWAFFNIADEWHVGERDGTSVTNSLTGLTPSTGYSYRWRSSNAYGIAWSPVDTFTTTP